MGKATGLDPVVRGKNEDENHLRLRREIQSHYEVGLKLRKVVSELCPEFLGRLEKSKETSKKRSLPEQITVVKTNIAKWVGRWIVMAKRVVDEKGVVRWIVDKEEWRRKLKSGDEGWRVEDKDWSVRNETGKKVWWEMDADKFKELGFTQNAFKRVFFPTGTDIRKRNRHAIFCGFVLGKDSMKDLETFTQELVDDDNTDNL